MKKILFILILSLGLVGCDDTKYIEKTSESLSRGVYAIADSLNKGREDLAEKYILDIEKLVPGPKKRIVVKPIVDAAGNKYLILSDTYKNGKIVIIGSDDFNQLLKDKEIVKQLKVDNTTYQSYQKESDKQATHNQDVTNQLIVDNNNLQKEVVEYHASFEYKVKHFFLFAKFLIPTSIIGIIVLCIFCPALIAPILSVLGGIAGIIVKIFNIGIEIASNLLSLIFAKKSVNS